jgi:TRAP-type C4-dicarboxylate transport system permease small subunit
VRRLLDGLYYGAGVLAAICLAAICVLMLAQSAGREVGILLRGADDIVSWLNAAVVFLALGHTFRHGELVRVGLWLDKVGPRVRRILEILSLLTAAVFACYTFYAVGAYMAESRSSGYMTQGLLVIPEWIPQVTFLLGLAVFLVAIVDELVRVLRGRKPEYQVAEDARRAAGDFSETL